MSDVPGGSFLARRELSREIRVRIDSQVESRVDSEFGNTNLTHGERERLRPMNTDEITKEKQIETWK